MDPNQPLDIRDLKNSFDQLSQAGIVADARIGNSIASRQMVGNHLV